MAGGFATEAKSKIESGRFEDANIEVSDYLDFRDAMYCSCREY
jgi:hypothetical protein